MKKFIYIVFMSSNKSIFVINFLIIFLFIYIKISKDSSAKHYQDNIERSQKSLLKKSKFYFNFFKKK